MKKKIGAHDITREQDTFTEGTYSELHNTLYVTVGHRIMVM